MASTTKFVADFRAEVTTMSEAFVRIKDLVDFYNTMGWSEKDFDTILPIDAELTAADFVTAVIKLGSLSTDFVAQAQFLTKLRP